MNEIVKKVAPTIVEVEFQATLIVPEGGNGRGMYEYRTRLPVEAGDAAVVEVNGALKVVTIRRIKSTQMYPGELKWLVDTVDVKPYIAILVEEKAIADELAALERESAQAKKVKKVLDGLEGRPDLKRRYEEVLRRKQDL